MIVCHCHAVTDRTIRRAARDGAVTLPDVASACGAGASCGGCVEAVEDVLRTESHAHAQNGTVKPPTAAIR